MTIRTTLPKFMWKLAKGSPNTALLTDAVHSAPRTARGAAKRER